MSIVEKISGRLYGTWDSYLTSDEAKIRKGYRLVFGVDPDLNSPMTFNEKLQWLKLNYRPTDLHRYVDKYAVREHITNTIGEQYLNDLLGVWDNAHDIDFESLPDRFVIKATHGSGMNLICSDKRKLDWDREKVVLNRQLGRSYYRGTREWAYKHVRPRLVAEKFLDCNGRPPDDYKIFCFNGEPKVIQVDCDRFDNHRRAMFDPYWQPLPLQYRYSWPDEPPPAPTNLSEQLNIAKSLAEGFPFIRVDLYSVSDSIYFGEMTFYPENGMSRFEPASWDLTLGSWLDLSSA